MANQWPPVDVRTRQYRSSTVPMRLHHPFSGIPPSLIPGHQSSHFLSPNVATDGVLYSGPSTSNRPMDKVLAAPVNNIPEYRSVSPSPYPSIGIQPPPPPPPPAPVPRPPVPVPPRPHQPEVPPLPPKPPIQMSPSISPVLPPKPPPVMYPPPPILRPRGPARSKSQPAPPVPRGPIHPPGAPPVPPPPVPRLPPKPLGARPASFTVTRVLFPQPQINVVPTTVVMPRPTEEGPGTDDTNPLTLPFVASPVEENRGMNEEEELELALKLSAQAEREHTHSLLSQDKELARVLEESLRDSPQRLEPAILQPRPLVLDVVNVPSPSSSSDRPWETTHLYSPTPTTSRVPSPLSAPSPVDVQLREDEELARRLEAEENERSATPTTDSDDDKVEQELPGYAQLPRYADVVGRETGTRECDVSSRFFG